MRRYFIKSLCPNCKQHNFHITRPKNFAYCKRCAIRYVSNFEPATATECGRGYESLYPLYPHQPPEDQPPVNRYWLKSKCPKCFKYNFHQYRPKKFGYCKDCHIRYYPLLENSSMNECRSPEAFETIFDEQPQQPKQIHQCLVCGKIYTSANGSQDCPRCVKEQSI